MSTPDTTELHTALAALRAAVDAAVPRLPDPDSASERDAAAVAWPGTWTSTSCPGSWTWTRRWSRC
jgi:hypothetical protein